MNKSSSTPQFDGIDIGDVSRSLTGSSSAESIRVPSFSWLQFFARKSKGAQKALRHILKRSIEFILYRQRMRKALAGEGHGVGCACDLCELQRQCAWFRSVIWWHIRSLRNALRWPKLARGVSVDIFAKKMVLTGYAAA